ncbi:MAG: gamma carbonic anhydrase family protein [Eubacteriales bacterium]|nr:gamma carbonic anhydrase family protein [Eubacteriales bacterium]
MIQSFDGKFPIRPRSAYVHPSAVVIGDVTLGENSSVWPGAVIRGDIMGIVIGKKTNIQDNSVLHTSKFKVVVGDMVTVGHGAQLHSCEVGSGTLVGMGAIIMDAAKIGENCVIAAGTVIPGGTVIPSGSVVMGNPYSIVRKVTPKELEDVAMRCNNYVARSKMYIRTANIL